MATVQLHVFILSRILEVGNHGKLLQELDV